MQRPFELAPKELSRRLEEMVDVTFSDLSSEFLLIPKGNSFIDYSDFRAAYEVLKRHTRAFGNFTEPKVAEALRENSRVLGVIRAILGMTSPEWAELARTELMSDITQGAARTLDRKCRERIEYVRILEQRNQGRLARTLTRSAKAAENGKSLERMKALVKVAIEYITQGAPEDTDGVIHRLAKFDTQKGIESLRYAAKEDVPYAVVLYERYLGRPFAGHRDAISGLIGEVMESAIEDRLRAGGVAYRKGPRKNNLSD